MTIWLSTLLFVAGLAGLWLAADALVRGAVILARARGLSPLTTGLTIVAFGGSAPELAVGVLAAAEGHPALALGNVIGSNLANLGLILGLCATIRAMKVPARVLTHEIAVMAGCGLALAALGLDGLLGRLDGTVLLAGFAGFLWMVGPGAGAWPRRVEREYEKVVAEVVDGGEVPPPAWRKGAALAAAGLAGLPVAAHLLVVAARYYAERLGIGEETVGLTVVALGTSLPELATSLVAVARKETEVALGNLVGSNVFNILAILGIATLVRPLAFDASWFGMEIPLLVVQALALIPLAYTRGRIERWEGGLLLLSYAAFLWLTVLGAGIAT